MGQVEVYNEIGMEYKYTGQNEIVSIGLYYYRARYYDPNIGRFITEDTYAGELVNPQSQNLYVYVMNNPFIYTDPSGHMEIITGEFGGDSKPESIEPEISEENIPLYFNIPYPNISAGNPNDFYFPLRFKNNFVDEIALTPVSVKYYRSQKYNGYAITSEETINYDYDRAGNRLVVTKEKLTETEGTQKESSISYIYDALNRINDETRNIEGKSYTTS